MTVENSGYQENLFFFDKGLNCNKMMLNENDQTISD